MRARRRVVGTLVSIGIMISFTMSTAASPAAAERTVLFGAHVGSRGAPSAAEAVAGFEQQIGRTLGIHHVYHAWNDDLIGDLESWSSSGGRTLLINWKAVLRPNGAITEPSYVRWASIAAGDHDVTIRSAAQELRQLGAPVYLAFHHEPEDEVDTSTQARCGFAADYRNAFRHIHGIFQDEGVTNVAFVWNLMGWTFQQGRADAWYPGDDVVDVVAANAYNWFGTDQNGGNAGWASFTQAFQYPYRWATARGKPFWVAETGSLEDPSYASRKAEWYLDMGRQALEWPNLEAIVYFTGARYGWWPDSSQRSLDAFRRVVLDSRMGGPGTG